MLLWFQKILVYISWLLSQIVQWLFGASRVLRDKANMNDALSTITHSEQSASGIIHVFGDIFISFLEPEKAESIAQNLFLGKFNFVQLSSTADSGVDFVPSCLAEIFRFDEMIKTTQRRSSSRSILLCSNLDLHVQLKCVFLTGCHLIMSHGFSSFQTSNVFKSLVERFSICESESFTLSCCWVAIDRAKCLGWIDFGNVFDVGSDEGRIIIEEYLHYARCTTPNAF